jgi:hypothetical protein
MTAEEILHKLLDALDRQDRVGAGMSTATGLPTWQGREAETAQGEVRRLREEGRRLVGQS